MTPSRCDGRRIGGAMDETQVLIVVGGPVGLTFGRRQRVVRTCEVTLTPRGWPCGHLPS
jgi:hypothetical protein